MPAAPASYQMFRNEKHIMVKKDGQHEKDRKNGSVSTDKNWVIIFMRGEETEWR